MGIESLNSAAAAAGFAMVSDEGVDETDSDYGYTEYISEPESRSAPANLPAVIDSSGRVQASTASLGALVTGMLDSWRSKG